MLLGQVNSSLPLELAVVGLGFFNGMFAVAAIGSMMSLAGSGSKRREGTRMGLWGAAQAIAAGFGGLLGTILVDLLQVADLSPVNAYGMVFSLEASLFALAALFASSVTYLIPIVAIFWGVFDGEIITFIHLLSIFLILSGIYLVNKK